MKYGQNCQVTLKSYFTSIIEGISGSVLLCISNGQTNQLEFVVCPASVVSGGTRPDMGHGDFVLEFSGFHPLQDNGLRSYRTRLTVQRGLHGFHARTRIAIRFHAGDHLVG